MRNPFTITLVTLASFSLAACELRRDASEEDADTPAGEIPADPTITDPEPTPSDTASPVASIIRDGPDAEPVELAPQTEPVSITIPFPEGSNISAAAERRLAGLMNEDAIEEDWPVILRGHTDSGGNDEANMRASRARAEAVAAWLVERGVDDERIEVIAFGEQNPIQPNAMPDGSPNESGRRANRRVEISIAPSKPEASDDDEDSGNSGESDTDA
ncbi:OmpA family protein [Aurantiacibacter poecillastricola]|uniref:OmpA family protein n=1 Tax=Aurantiacibacter poecillastricola TaxID=3064385 RepID=UPI0027401589|nr:OmpA family protein [Aurantiacibacter sp. 219JJ12-13]MDP5260409.1 OmpA family protein [Aurantiacibacter sp. 219JJ12-13]